MVLFSPTYCTLKQEYSTPSEQDTTRTSNEFANPPWKQTFYLKSIRNMLAQRFKASPMDQLQKKTSRSTKSGRPSLFLCPTNCYNNPENHGQPTYKTGKEARSFSPSIIYSFHYRSLATGAQRQMSTTRLDSKFYRKIAVNGDKT